MAEINTGNFGSDLLPGISKYVGDTYKDLDLGFKGIFSIQSSDRAFERDVMDGGLDLARKKPEGSSIQYDTMEEHFQKDYNHTVYATGFRITREAIDDAQSGHVMKTKSSKLAKAMGHTKDIVCANVLNRAFNSDYKGGDAKELCATDHPTQGDDLRNELSTSSTLSEASLEQAVFDIMDFRDTRGLRADISPRKLIVPKELMFEADRILHSDKRVGVADNDKNSIGKGGYLPDGIHVWRRLSSSTAWYILTDAEDGLKIYERDGIEMSTDNDFDAESAKFKARMRFAVGWTDPRGLFGSPGTA